MTKFILAQLDAVALPHVTFTADALALVVRASEGYLRRARNLCLGALVESVRDHTRAVDLKQLNHVLVQPPGASTTPRSRRRRPLSPISRSAAHWDRRAHAYSRPASTVVERRRQPGRTPRQPAYDEDSVIAAASSTRPRGSTMPPSNFCDVTVAISLISYDVNSVIAYDINSAGSNEQFPEKTAIKCLTERHCT
jgi:hypothetical protein